MWRRRLTALLVATAAVTGAVTTTASAVVPDTGTTVEGAGNPFTFALIGDTPYGDVQRAQFPALATAINADPQVRMVLHAGDVKNGKSSCSDERFADLTALFNTFKDPFVLTPGDNEWTDCYRTADGSYLPTERLQAVRHYFFRRPGRTGGDHRMRVRTQARDHEHDAYVENVLFKRARVVFATVHVVGSNNDLEPWAQLPGGDRPTERLAEFRARQAAALDWIDDAFDRAEHVDAAGVLLLMQAEPKAEPGFAAIRNAIARRATAFRGPVLLVHGDEHRYEVERRYAGVPNLTRLETFGNTATRWLRVTVDRRAPAVFTWTPQTVCRPPQRC